MSEPTNHVVDGERDKNNNIVVIVPEDAKPGDQLTLVRTGPPIYCYECAESSIGIDPGGYVSVPSKRIMDLRRVKPDPEQEVTPVAKPSSFSLE